MANVTAIVKAMPDNDNFLPCDLTAQLITMLAQSLPTAVYEPKQLSTQASAFIKAYKTPDLFTPLTYSIFWRENSSEILEKYTQSLDQVDKYSHSPLTIAIANEDFALAVKLIQRGAIICLEDKLALEIALTCIIQRNPDIIGKLVAVDEENKNEWVKKYLDFLNDYINGKLDAEISSLHDVFDPTIRHFGQILDTMTYFNGTPSHYGFISPSLDVLTRHFKIFINELKEPITAGFFRSIAEAFEYCQKTCNFHGNLPTNTAADSIAKRINTNLAGSNKMVTFVIGGFAGNSLALAFINKTVIFSNLGIGGDPNAGTKIFTINNPANITSTAIDSFMRGLGNASAPTDILALLGDMVDPNPLFTIKQSLAPIDNCIFVNPRAIIQGMLLVLDAYQKNNSLTADILAIAASKAEATYLDYLNSLYKNTTQELSKFMRNHEALKVKRIECCSLALDFINQHYNNQESIRRCIELKNALEFVGLKHLFDKTVLPEAKAAIQKVMIRDQEITAVKVIEQERAMMASQAATEAKK